MPLQCRWRSVLIVFALALAGCAGNQNAAYQSIHQAFFGNNPDFSALPKDPSIVYLDVSFAGTQARLGRGYLYPTKPSPTEVYYSAKGDLLRLQGNRLLATAGLPVNFQNVQYQFNGQGGLVVSYSQSPNGMGNQQIQLNLVGPLSGLRTQLPVPANQRAAWVWYGAQVTTPGVFPNKYMYMVFAFPHTLESTQLNSGEWPQAVYGIQCLQPELCLEWHRP